LMLLKMPYGSICNLSDRKKCFFLEIMLNCKGQA